MLSLQADCMKLVPDDACNGSNTHGLHCNETRLIVHAISLFVQLQAMPNPGDENILLKYLAFYQRESAQFARANLDVPLTPFFLDTHLHPVRPPQFVSSIQPTLVVFFHGEPVLSCLITIHGLTIFYATCSADYPLAVGSCHAVEIANGFSNRPSLVAPLVAPWHSNIQDTGANSSKCRVWSSTELQML